MTATLNLSRPYQRQDGHIGAQAVLEIQRPDGWHQRYAFDTHGMTSTEVAARAAALEAHHAAKALRLSGFRAIQGAEFFVDGDTYRIVDCTIFDAGVTLYLDARRIAYDGTAHEVHGFPVRLNYHTVDAVPPDEEILAMLRLRLAEVAMVDVEAAHAEFVAKVAARRG